MRSIAAGLNIILKPTLRMRTKPTPNPIAQEEITKIQHTTAQKPEPPTSGIQRLKDMSREVERANLMNIEVF